MIGVIACPASSRPARAHVVVQVRSGIEHFCTKKGMAHHPADSAAFCNEPAAAGPHCVHGAVTDDATPSHSEATAARPTSEHQAPKNVEDSSELTVSLPSKGGVGETLELAPGCAVSKRKRAKEAYEIEYSERKKQLIASGLLKEELEYEPEAPNVSCKPSPRVAYMKAYYQRKRRAAEADRRRPEEGAACASTSSALQGPVSSKEDQGYSTELQQKRRRASVRSQCAVEMTQPSGRPRRRQKERAARRRAPDDSQSGIGSTAHEMARGQQAEAADENGGGVSSSPPSVSENAGIWTFDGRLLQGDGVGTSRSGVLELQGDC